MYDTIGLSLYNMHMKKLLLSLIVILSFSACFGYGPLDMPVESDVYKLYDQNAFEIAKDKSQIALFFYLEGCPLCIAKEKDILAHLDQFPQGSIVYKVNFRSETRLKNKYRVTAQDTLVTFDNDGNFQTRLGLPAQMIIDTFLENSNSVLQEKNEILFEPLDDTVNISSTEESPKSFLRILGDKALTQYSISEFENAPDKSKVALFFSAEWCSTCSAKEKEIVSTEFVAGVKILQIDFDSAFDLRKQYGVTVQDTFITFDSEGSPTKHIGISIDDLRTILEA